MNKFRYNISDFDFSLKVRSYLDCDSLDDIHIHDKFKGILTDVDGEFSDQGQDLHLKFYRSMDNDPSFKQLYDKFVKEVIRLNFEHDIIYQKYPTFRIHQPDNICVFEWHKDKEFNHNPKEINVYLPITSAFGTNTFWTETSEDKGDYFPVEAEHGEYILWNGANLRHGNKINDTSKTRISFDFRIMKYADYDESISNNNSLTKKTKFIIGDYFDEKII